MPGNPSIGYYRIRSIGTAELAGLKRVGMDNRMDENTRGDSLLRKIDFGVEHFLSTYGYGDALATAAPTSANGKQTVAVANAKKPQVTRRVELVALPVMGIEGALKVSGSFNGPGSAGVIDSYDSKNGEYPGINPPAPYDVDAHDGDVACGSATFSQGGWIYGDVSTRGGNASTTRISGVVDNDVTLILPPQPDVQVPAGVIANTTRPATINPPYSVVSGVPKTEYWYDGYANISGLTVNPVVNPSGETIETIVHIRASGDVSSITVNKGATVNLYFKGNMDTNSNSLENENEDGLDQALASPAGQQEEQRHSRR